MLTRVYLKIIIATALTLVSTIGFAATQMDCGVSDPPSTLHDVIVRKEGNAISVLYTYPWMHQDKWYGPFSGMYKANGGGSIFSFKDGTVISLDKSSSLGRSTGRITLGLDGRKAEITCNKPY